MVKRKIMYLVFYLLFLPSLALAQETVSISELKATAPARWVCEIRTGFQKSDIRRRICWISCRKCFLPTASQMSNWCCTGQQPGELCVMSNKGKPLAKILFPLFCCGHDKAMEA